MLQFIV